MRWVSLPLLCFLVGLAGPARSDDAALAAVGKRLYFDNTLSAQSGMSCATCHAPIAGFAALPSGQIAGIAAGSTGKFGFRNAPTVAYAAFTPPFRYDAERGGYVGGLFWDGRVDTLEQQAANPLLNALEMNNRTTAQLVAKLRLSGPAADLQAAFGARLFDDETDAFRRLTEAIAAYERTPEVSPFSSRFDGHLRGAAQLSPAEARGLAIFTDPARGNCASCHAVARAQPLFTDFGYANIGVPRNPANPYYRMPPAINPDGAAFVDRGLGANPKVRDPAFDGFFKVPTLRNVALTPPYMHNGVSRTLEEAVRFHNSACAPGNPDGWPPPEVPATRQCDRTGHLGLTQAEIGDLVSFLRTLTDR